MGTRLNLERRFKRVPTNNILSRNKEKSHFFDPKIVFFTAVLYWMEKLIFTYPSCSCAVVCCCCFFFVGKICVFHMLSLFTFDLFDLYSIML